MVQRIYRTELQLNKANASDTEAAFIDLNLSVDYVTVSSNIYDKRDNFDFDSVYFRLTPSKVTSLGVPLMVYISQLIRFVTASSHLSDFNSRNNF